MKTPPVHPPSPVQVAATEEPRSDPPPPAPSTEPPAAVEPDPEPPPRPTLERGEPVVAYHHKGKRCEVTITRDPKLVEVTTISQAIDAIAAPALVDGHELREAEPCSGQCVPGRPLAVPLYAEFDRDVIFAGMVLPWAPEQLFVLPEQLSLMRVFHCQPEVEVTVTPRPESWAHMLGLQSREEGYRRGSSCDPLMDDDCSVGCLYDTRTDIDFLVDPTGRAGTLLVERITKFRRTEEGSATPAAIELRDEPDGLHVTGCGADSRVAW